MNTVDLSTLFAPTTVAVVGASPDRHYSRSIVANLTQHGFSQSAIHLVNPRYDVVDGLPCVASLADLPVAPDVVAVLLGRRSAAATVEQAIAVGARAALVIADGYAEESAAGAADQHALGASAREAGLALLGPNTLGYVVPASGAGMWCAGTLPKALSTGGVAMLAQSSGMLNLVMAVAGQRELGMRACVSVGNAEVIGLPELVDHFVRDDACTTIALIIESIDRPQDLMDALAAARAAGKPVIALKIGTSELGRQNSVAHTGRLAGPAQGWLALFDRAGVTVTRDLDDFLETVTLFGGVGTQLAQLAGRPDGMGVAFATISGGETSLVCDIAEQEGLPFAALSDATLDILRTSLGKQSMIGNPADLQNTRTARPDVFWRCIDALCADDGVDVMAVRLNLSVRPSDTLRQVYQEIVSRARDAGAVPIVLTRAYEYLDLEWWSFFRSLDVPFLLSYRNAVRALAALNRWSADRERVFQRPGAVPARPLHGAAGTRVLDAAASAAWLDDAGLATYASASVDDPEDAARAAGRIGFPVALKAVAPGLVHKTEAGGVVLDLADARAVIDTARAMRDRVATAVGIAAEQVGFEVQQMVGDGVELMVGMTADPTWGPVVMVGTGGIHAETLRDVVWDLPPVSAERAGAMVRRLRSWPLLDGARSTEPADVDALVDLIVAFSESVVTAGEELTAVDINPVVVRSKGHGAVAVDAAVLVRDDNARLVYQEDSR